MNIAAIVAVVRPSVWLPNRLKPTSKVPTANEASNASSIEACTKCRRGSFATAPTSGVGAATMA